MTPGQKWYSEKRKDPRWQKKRLEVLERDEWACQLCFGKETTLHVHHRWYERGKDPWEYADGCYLTLCEDCHASESEDRARMEEHLLKILKRHFLASDLQQLAAGFGQMQMPQMSDYTASAIATTLASPELLDRLMTAYADFIRANAGRRAA